MGWPHGLLGWLLKELKKISKIILPKNKEF
jgi:hypothetical protein